MGNRIEHIMKQKILYLDMDNVLVDFPSGIARLSPDIVEQYQDKLDEVPGIFALMNPLEGAVQAFCYLCELFDTYIRPVATAIMGDWAQDV